MKVLLSALILMLFASYHSIAQPQGGQPQNPPAVPITGIEILLVGGGAFGIYRLARKTGNKNKEI